MFYSVKKSEFIKYVVKLMEVSEQDMKDQTELVCSLLINTLYIYFKSRAHTKCLPFYQMQKKSEN